MRPLRDVFRDEMPAVVRAFPAIAFVYLGGGAATGDLRPWERIAIAYGLRRETGTRGEGVGAPPPGAFDEDALFADLAARFDTNDIDLFDIEKLPPDSLALFLRDAIPLIVADSAAQHRFLDRTR